MNLTAAKKAWIALAGEDLVSTPIRSAGQSTYADDAQVILTVRPGDKLQLQECVRIALSHKVPFHVASTGKNWGYGSRQPVAGQSVLFDLGRINRILHYDDTMGTLTVEPGVTQQQAFDFLQARGGNHWLDVTGSSAHTSIVGNIAERGFGHTMHGDRFEHTLSMEVLLPDGRLLRTGFGRFRGALASNTYKWGTGPYLDGLFTQSNLGIITELTIALMPRPEKFEAYFFKIDDENKLGPLIDALRPLRQRGVIQNAAHMGNIYKVMAAICQYPWHETDGLTPVPVEILAGY